MSATTELERLIKTEYISINGIRLHCVTAGQGELVVLLHGFPEHWYSWRHQINALSSRYQVLAPDQRGYNLSDKPTSIAAYDIDQLADDVAELIKHFGAKQAVVVGHDWGGGVAWWTAIRHPQLVKKLIVLNCPHPIRFQQVIRGFDQLSKSWYMFFFQLPWLPEWFIRGGNARRSAEKIFRGTAIQKQAFSDEDIERLATALDQPGALTCMVNYYRAAFRRMLKRPKADPIEMPTLLIWGEGDRFLVRRNTEGLERWVKNLTVKFVPNSGHWVQQEQSEMVNRLMLDFIG